MPLIAKPKWMTWAEVVKRVWLRANDDDVSGRAAELAYYFLLAIFPLLILLISLLGLFSSVGRDVSADVMVYLSMVLPDSASALVSKTLHEITASSGGAKLSFGLIGSLWSASVGMSAVIDTLNAEYGVKEGRSFFKLHALSIFLTIAVSGLMLTAVVMVLFGDRLAQALPLGGLTILFWKIVQWPLALICVLLGFAATYYFAPDVEQRRWHWITPGSIIGVGLWLLASLALRIYLHLFNTFSATYGSLGAAIVLLLWFYLTGAAILLGAEVNVVIENAAADEGTPEAKQQGQKHPKRAA